MATASCVAAARVFTPAAFVVTTVPLVVTAAEDRAREVAAEIVAAAGRVSVPVDTVKVCTVNVSVANVISASSTSNPPVVAKGTRPLVNADADPEKTISASGSV